MICPIYDQSAKPQAKAHGCACGSPICNPSGDCEGHYKNCTVPSFIWQKLILDKLNIGEVEVIGNIYDNPDLLEAK
ncbi:MAG TPA: YopX family protein [Ruminococcus flavefaciens]|nr:YopX family protein [Ruminococcus flavefaciens]